METDRIDLSSPLLGMKLTLLSSIAAPIVRETSIAQVLMLRSHVDLEVLT
jgi:hypothetical protein